MSSKYENVKKGFRKGLGTPGKRKTFGDLIDAITPDFSDKEEDDDEDESKEIEMEIEVITPIKKKEDDDKKKKPKSRKDGFKAIRDALLNR